MQASGSMKFGGIAFLLTGLAAIVGGIAGGGDAASTLIPMGVIFAGCSGVFFWVGSWGVMDNGPLEDDQLQRFGRPAYATVLEVQGPESLTDSGARTRLKLNVTPANESEYKAKVEVPASRPVPSVGDTVSVKFDPNKRKSLILIPAALSVPTATPTARDPIARLEKLSALRRAGTLTDSEFEVQKAKLLQHVIP